MKKAKQQPTAEEKQLAVDLQAPDKPQQMVKAGVFSMLLQQPTVDASQLLGGDKTVWINTMEDHNELFPAGGDFSRPFFALKAWFFASKSARQKARIGLKIALPDEQIYHVSLSYPLGRDNAGMYKDRRIILQHFENSSTPVGLMQFQKIDRGQSNSYWRLIYADQHSIELAGEQPTVMGMPEDTSYATSEDDDEVPF